jgi:tetratricopeptide (TPR) repeat protein
MNIVKQISLIIMLVFIGLASTSQVKKTATVTTPGLMNTHIRVFNQCMNSGDVVSAALALNYYINDQGENNNYVDTLAILYMQQGAFPQCYYWANKRLEMKPEDNLLLELKGICLDKMQQPKEAINIFEKLFQKTQSPYHAYKLMELQYGIKRLSECLATGIAAEKLTYKPEFVMTYAAGQQTGRTYLQAGIYNILGLTYYDLDKKVEAKNYFMKALALDSSFVLPKQNLEAMESIEKGNAAGQQAAPQNANTPAKKEN